MAAVLYIDGGTYTLSRLLAANTTCMLTNTLHPLQINSLF